MECSCELSSLVRLLNIIQEQLESSSGKPQKMKHVSGNVKNLKLSINLARDLLLKEDLFLQVENSWQHQLDVLTGLCYDAEDVVSQMEYEMTIMYQMARQPSLKPLRALGLKIMKLSDSKKVLSPLEALGIMIMELSLSKKVVMPSLKGYSMPNILMNCQRLLKVIIKEMRLHLELIRIQTTPVHLPMKPYKRPSHCSVPLFGRDEDKETIVDYLMSNENYLMLDDENPDGLGISIIGMHGVGKSALALDIVNDERVKCCYEIVLWASLTGPFNHQDICEQVVACSHYGDTQVSKSTFLNHLRDKKSLLVLDNLLDVTSTEWFDFRSLYPASSRGKILITSTNNDIALVTQTTRYYLLPLSNENCEEVINSRSGVPEIDRLSLSAEIESLAKKCHGLPIVANFLGIQVKDENQRTTLLNKDLWKVPEFKKEIWPSLTSTYSMLEPNLKKCFAYLSLYPLDYGFEMGDLIQLWIAEGFVEWPDESSLEQVCNEYLRIFKRWLILLPFDDRRQYCKIHQFTYDLAKLVSSNTCFCLDETHSFVLDINTRHLSLTIWNEPHLWNEIQKLKLSNSGLRTFLSLDMRFRNVSCISYIPTTFFKSVPYLRVLSLKRSGIHKIPNSIRMLKFLRYLDVSETNIKHLPNAVSKILSLQILKLKNCPNLKHLPRKFKNLINLRYIDCEVEDMSRLVSMPPSIGSLTRLQRLPLFQVGAKNGFRVVELKNMVHLQGSICIKDLQHVQDQKEAEAAELSSKVSLKALELQWSSWCSNARNAADVLTALQPHEDLIELKITNYDGQKFPQWLSQLQKLRDLAIVNCRNLTSLASFEHQTSLLNLKIVGCSKLSLLPKLPPSANPPIIENCDLIPPINLGSDGQRLPTSGNSSNQILEGDAYSKGEEFRKNVGLEKERRKSKLSAEVIEESSPPIRRIDEVCEIMEEGRIDEIIEERRIDELCEINIADIKETKRKIAVRDLFKAELEQKKLTAEEIEYHLKVQEDMRLFCIMFSHDYDFEEETLIQLWIETGFLEGEHKNYIGHLYFRILLNTGYISHTGTNFNNKKEKYRANVDLCNGDLAKLMLNEPLSKTLLWVGDDFGERSRTALMNNLHKLKALFVSKNSFSIPQCAFSALNLEILHLGGTRITNLPSSIGNLVRLRYLDLSSTLIEALPDSVTSLMSLKTLKLNNCEHMQRLPGETRKLTSLEHLELDVLGQLAIMPRGMGALTKLETLSGFIVHNDDGRSIKELKNMNNLKGSFCISKLENVMDPNEAEEASLGNKKFLKELELRWSDTHERGGSRSVHHEDILCLLQPYTDLEQLCISCYGGETFPHWISSPSFQMLSSITLFKCDDAEVLPSLGQLPSLKSLTLMEMNNVKEIGEPLLRGLEDKFIAFPSLETFEIIGLSQLKTWTDTKEGDYFSLRKIIVEQCPKLEGIPSSFFQLPRLQHMEILHCSALTLLPAERLWTSATLIIDECPLVTKEFKKRKGKHWLNKVQDAWIDQEPINDSNRRKSRFISSCFAS